MSYSGDIGKASKQLADVYVSDKTRIKQLQKILEKDLGRKVSFNEAKEIGTDLVDLYKALAGDQKIIRGGLKNRDRLNVKEAYGS